MRLDFGASFKITLAGLAATTLFSAAGAGGVALTYWALRKAGMERRQAASRMVAFIVLLYSAYAAALIVFGVLIRTGVLNGEAPVAGTIVPAGIAVVLFVIVGLPGADPGRPRAPPGPARGAPAQRPHGEAARHGARDDRHRACASRSRTCATRARAPAPSAARWATGLGMVGIMWASFHAFGGGVPFGVVVMGFFVGMAANLAPSPAAGVGTLDAGMIGAYPTLRCAERDGLPGRACVPDRGLLAADPAGSDRLLPAPPAGRQVAGRQTLGSPIL